MLDKITNSIISAIMGGLVSLSVLFMFGPKQKFDSLEVGSLRITEQLAVRPPGADNDDVMIKSGSLMVKNKVVATQFLGTQFSGHVLVGNRMFTTPDNIFQKPVEQWQFFTELGSDPISGGEIVVRSPQGGNAVGREVETGHFVKVGFDRNDLVQIYVQNNETKGVLPIAVQQQKSLRSIADIHESPRERYGSQRLMSEKGTGPSSPSKRFSFENTTPAPAVQSFQTPAAAPR